MGRGQIAIDQLATSYEYVRTAPSETYWVGSRDEVRRLRSFEQAAYSLLRTRGKSARFLLSQLPCYSTEMTSLRDALWNAIAILLKRMA